MDLHGVVLKVYTVGGNVALSTVRARGNSKPVAYSAEYMCESANSKAPRGDRVGDQVGHLLCPLTRSPALMTLRHKQDVVPGGRMLLLA